MNDENKLKILKFNLQILGNHENEYLIHLLNVAKDKLKNKYGIEVGDSLEDADIQIQYAAYQYRKRASNDPMPKMLEEDLKSRFIRKEKENV